MSFEKSAETAAPTLGETVPLFIQLYAKPKNRDWKDAQRLLALFPALFVVPLDGICAATSCVLTCLSPPDSRGANRALSTIKKLMNWALDRGMIEVNPIAGLKPPAKEYARERILTDRELNALLVAADAQGYPFGDMFKMLVLTGQRRGEVTGMRWSEIYLDRRVLALPAARSKNQKSNDVPLSDPVVEILRSVPRFLILTTFLRPQARRRFPGLGAPRTGWTLRWAL